jgi:hypothetical protein
VTVLHSHRLAHLVTILHSHQLAHLVTVLHSHRLAHLVADMTDLCHCFWMTCCLLGVCVCLQELKLSPPQSFYRIHYTSIYWSKKKREVTLQESNCQFGSKGFFFAITCSSQLQIKNSSSLLICKLQNLSNGILGA